MALCLVGNHPVDKLEELAIEHFSEVVNKDLPDRDFTKEDPLYDETSLGHLTKIVPVKDLRQLTIDWP